MSEKYLEDPYITPKIDSKAEIKVGNRLYYQCNGGGIHVMGWDIIEDIFYEEEDILIKTKEGIISWNTCDWVDNRPRYRKPIEKELYYINETKKEV